MLRPVRDAGTRPHREVAGPDARFVRVGPLDLHFRTWGEGRPAFVLLHHFFGNVDTWRKVAPGLAEDGLVVAFDRPGFGLTERPPRRRWDGENPYTRAFSARATIALLDHLGVEQAVLVGASAGGTVAIETAARHPDRVAALALVAPAITADVGAPPAMRPVLRQRLVRPVGQRVARLLARGITAERVGRSWHDPARVTDADAAAYRRPLGVDDWDTGFWELVTVESPPDLRDTLPHLRMPTMVVSGDSDGVVRPDATRRTAAQIPGADFRLLPRCGHTPHEECPEALVAALREFVAGLADPPR